MRRTNVSGLLMNAVDTGSPAANLTSVPSHNRNAKLAGSPANTSRRMRAARAAVGRGMRRSIMARSPPDGPHHVLVLEGTAGLTLEDDLSAVDGVQAVGDPRARHQVGLGDEQR